MRGDQVIRSLFLSIDSRGQFAGVGGFGAQQSDLQPTITSG